MANRTFHAVQSLDRETKHLYGYVTFGASGAIATSDCLGFAVTKVAATTGQYLVTFSDGYPSMLFWDATLMNAGTAKGDQLEAREVYQTSDSTITLEYINDAGSAADITSGDAVWFHFVMRNTTVARKGL
jgi:hypothetical protein